MKPTVATEKLFDVVEREVRRLWFDVLTWRGLSSEDTVAKLNRHAPEFFSLVQFRLYDSHHLRICRLLDPPRSKRRDVRSVSALALIGAVRTDGAATLAANMNDELKAMRKLARGIEWTRDRLIAHLDEDACLGVVAPFVATTFADVEEIARRAGAMINLYAGAFRDTTIAFDPAAHGIKNFDPVGVDRLLRSLDLADRYRQENPLHGFPAAARRRLLEIDHA